MTTKGKQPEDFIVPLNMNGLEGRMMRLPAPKAYLDREILVIYGHHSSLERWWGLAQNFNVYGAVTMPDLPGFGGMDSLYKIGKRPDLDSMADYLASFVKWRFKRKKVVIVGLSYGFLVATRMLQRYPELLKKVDILVSAVGFAHSDDFVFSKPRMTTYRIFSRLLSRRPMPFLFRYTALDPAVLRTAYHKTFNAKKKFADANPEDAKRMMDMEIVLWHINHVRTHWYTTYEMLTVDNCTKRVNIPVWHIAASTDQYFHQELVEQHMRVIFSDFFMTRNPSTRHAPSVIATAKESSSFIPQALRREIRRLDKKS
jgi:pimeloyl-ACP methyl ester carboxylesterase